MSMQVTKVWWDGEKLMAEPIDPAAIYKEPEQPAQQEPLRPGFAGVTLWLGDAVVTQVVTEMQIQLEREPGAALTYAAQKCLAIYAGARSNT